MSSTSRRRNAGAVGVSGAEVGATSAATPGNGPRNVLVIVESPAKARTITSLLKQVKGGRFDGYKVHACNGHVRNLVQKRREVPLHLKEATKKWEVLGVDVDNGFAPLYVTSTAAKKVVDKLRNAAVGCDEMVLATDEDREGEAISWHLTQVLEPTVPVKRAVFHEITLDALVKAFESPREIDIHLVQAQEARRVLDRLAGFTMSPLMWRLIGPGLSAGRVQSVALAMVVERERARLRFKSAEYWGVTADLVAADCVFQAHLVRVGSKALVTRKDFDPETGELKASLDASTLELLEALKASSLAGSLSSLRVSSVERRRVSRKPPAPFITSTLQQEGSSKLGIGATQTMMAAQALYEAGLITYMRTDKPSLSTQAAEVAKQAVRETFGDAYVHSGQIKTAKIQGSQEAHEAIRPALVLDGSDSPSAAGSSGYFRSPEDLPESLTAQQRSLYELVYRRALASVMAESSADVTTVTLVGEGLVEGDTGREVVEVTLRATGRRMVFQGFLKAYEEHRVDGGAGDEDSADSASGGDIPELEEGSEVACRSAAPTQHKTMPPRRYTEATFVKELEAKGVGRPSTYAHILETLRSRTYATVQRRRLTPSLTGMVVADVLTKHFPDFTDTRFTAQMEDKLDEIAHGKTGRVEYLSGYYLGEAGLRARVKQKQETIDWQEAKRVRVPGLEGMEDRCAIFVGPYGGYLVDLQHGVSSTAQDQVSGQPRSASSPDGSEDSEGSGGEGAATALDVLVGKEAGDAVDSGMEAGEQTHRITVPYAAQEDLELLTEDLIERCLDSSFKGGDVLGQHPDTGEDILIRMGPYGPYLQCGALKTAAVPRAGSSKQAKDYRDAEAVSASPEDLLADGIGPGLGGEATAAFPSSRDTVVRELEALPALDGWGGVNGSAEAGGGFPGEVGGKSTAMPMVDDSSREPWYSMISLERAVGLLSLPRVVCEHPRAGGQIKVGIGRFGPYVNYNDSFKAVPGGVDVLDVGEEMAVSLADALIQASIDRPVIKLGVHEGEPVLLKPGRFQQVITCGATKLPLPSRYRAKPSKGEEELTLEVASALVDAKRAKEAGARRRAPGSSTKERGARGQRKSGPSKTRAATGTAGGGGEQAPTGTRPVSSFFRFCRECREAAAVEDPGARLTAQDLSERWKALPAAERTRYDDAWREELAAWTEQNRVQREKSSKRPKQAKRGKQGKRLNPYALFVSDFAAENKGRGTRGETLMQLAAKAWRGLDEGKRSEYERRAMESKRESDGEGSGAGEVAGGPPKKARNPYLLFLEERMALLQGEGLAPKERMSHAAKAWREMEDEEKEVYRRRSSESLQAV